MSLGALQASEGAPQGRAVGEGCAGDAGAEKKAETEMTEEKFQEFDIVRCISAGVGDQQCVGSEYVVQSFHSDEIGDWLTVYNKLGGVSGGNDASRFGLVYRPPTREEVESLRSRVAELEAALRPFADYRVWTETMYKAARKAMGLE